MVGILTGGVAAGRWAPHRAKQILAQWAGGFRYLGLPIPSLAPLGLTVGSICRAIRRLHRGRGEQHRRPISKEQVMEAMKRAWDGPHLGRHAPTAAAAIYIGFHGMCRPGELRGLRWEELHFGRAGPLQWVEARVTDKTHLSANRHIQVVRQAEWAGAFDRLREQARDKRGSLLPRWAWLSLQGILKAVAGVSLAHLRPGGNMFWTGRAPDVLVEHAAGWAAGSPTRARYYTQGGGEGARLWHEAMTPRGGSKH